MSKVYEKLKGFLDNRNKSYYAKAISKALNIPLNNQNQLERIPELKNIPSRVYQATIYDGFSEIFQRCRHKLLRFCCFCSQFFRKCAQFVNAENAEARHLPGGIYRNL